MFRIYKNPKREDYKTLFKRPEIDTDRMENTVREVFDSVRQTGDRALIEFTEKFDRVKLPSLAVNEEEIKEACAQVSPALKEAIRTAAANIEKFHASQDREEQPVETTPGITCWRRNVPIEKVGLYVPGGTAPLLSTVLMLAIPARVAGCKEIILCTPPNKEGKIADEILFAASLTGVSRIFKLGGIQAVAAMTLGTETVPAVYKIFGPGNQYVTAAKQYAGRFGVSIDLPAGPSEVMVVADGEADPEFICADLTAQLEHGGDSQAILLTRFEKVAEAVGNAMSDYVKRLSRQEILARSIDNLRIVVAGSFEQEIELINEYAPEHLILNVADENAYLPLIINSGSVFVGRYTPESLGDYASGTNHTLPTSGWAKSVSGVSYDSFVKKITFQKATPEGLENIGATVTAMAGAEGLDAHAAAVTVRTRNKAGETGTDKKGTENLYIRDNIRALKPYSCARDEFKGEASVMLDANESPFDLYEQGYNRYPDPQQWALKKKISEIKGIPVENMLLGNGSDECIDILYRTFCRPGRDNVVTLDPTYGMYGVSAVINDVVVRKSVLNPATFAMDTEDVLGKTDIDTRMIVLCSPNNPTGNALPLAQIREIAERFGGIVVVDEAYIDFSPEQSAVSLMKDLPNLIVMQTLSKAWGLANLRLGVLYADPKLIAVFNKVKAPYNISGASQVSALKQLTNRSAVDSYVSAILSERKRLQEDLKKIPLVKKIFPSDTNFLLVRFERSDEIFAYLLSKGIVVRSRNRETNCAGCLRITVGTKQENDELISALKNFK